MNLGQMARAEDRHSNHWEEQHFLDTSNLEAGEEAGKAAWKRKECPSRGDHGANFFLPVRGKMKLWGQMVKTNICKRCAPTG